MIYLNVKGQRVQVTPGLGKCWISEIVAPSGGRHRVKSAALPPRKTRQEAQRDLDAYANLKRWRTA